MPEMIDITPHVNLLVSFRGFPVNYVTLLGEAIDNGFDAGANAITATIDKESVVIVDDGQGVTGDRLPALLSIGSHGGMTTTALGRFGIGIKMQAVNAGDLFIVDSASHDGRFRIEVNWRELLSSQSWSVPAPRWYPLGGEATGTAIVIGGLRVPFRKNLALIGQEIAHRFRPALAGGKTIRLNGTPLSAPPDPEMIDIVETDLLLSTGRRAKLRAGILTAPSPFNRVDVAYRHRMIMLGQSLGCESYSGLAKMYARVEIFGSWHLGQFKDTLADDNETEELEEALAEVLRPILEKCNASAMSARLGGILDRVNAGLPPQLIPARPRHQAEAKPANEKRERPKAENPGFVDPQKANAAPSPAQSRRPVAGLKITFDGELSNDGVYRFTPGGQRRPDSIDLAREHPAIARLLAHRDDDLIADAIRLLAISFWHKARNDISPQLELALEGSPGEQLAALLADHLKGTD